MKLMELFDIITDNYVDLWEIASSFQSQELTEADSLLEQEDAWVRIGVVLKKLDNILDEPGSLEALVELYETQKKRVKASGPTGAERGGGA